jgi:maleate isomerase
VGGGEPLARLFPQARVGVITPSANPALEYEMRAALPEQVGIHATRLPAHADVDLAARVAAYRDDLAAAVASFGALPLRAILFGCTASSYPIGPDGDRALSRSVPGRPVVTAAGAVGDLFAALGARRIHLVTPYPDWLTRQCVSYWDQAGYPVASVTTVDSGALYETTDRDTYAAVTLALSDAAGPGDAVLVAGTGAASLRALDAAGTLTDVPLLSSNLAGAVRLAQLCGWDATLRLSRHLAIARLANLLAVRAEAA